MSITAVELLDLERVLKDRPDGVAMGDLVGPNASESKRKAMRNRLAKLISAGRARSEGERRWTRYYAVSHDPVVATPPPSDKTPGTFETNGGAVAVPLSPAGIEIQSDIRRPEHEREPVTYNRLLLSSYQPNKAPYLSPAIRDHLRKIGAVDQQTQPAGTYARHIMDRLLIDLSWSSSRLEGNTYSILDTQNLIEKGKIAEGKSAEETAMILNHKNAIEFLVDAADDIGFNRYTLLNLHSILADGLLDPNDTGRLRQRIVGISGTVYTPSNNPQVIDECFTELLAKATAITDPFEQSFFATVHLPYLQPFADVNKRVSRLAANIPFIKRNLVPISFIDVPKALYVEAMLGVYELNKIELARDMFVWAYERSARRYTAIQQSFAAPDAFRLRYREQLRSVVSEVIRERADRSEASQITNRFARENIVAVDQAAFLEAAERELFGLHEGNFARYKIRPSEFYAWKAAWEAHQA